VRGGALPAALLCASVGLAIAFAPRRAWIPSIAILTATAIVAGTVVFGVSGLESVFFGCWMSVAASAATVHIPRGLRARGALVLSLNGGLWSGGVIAAAGSHADLLEALPCVLVLLPAAWIVRSDALIVVKVISSWLIAIAMLAATLALLPVTPGYMPDHLE
jgi:hypothetical protein